MFLLRSGDILVNEVAPRPHNSGHYTIDGCVTSQFEQHIRAVLGWPLGDCSLNTECAIMLNLLGKLDGDEGLMQAQEVLNKAMTVPGASIHWYDKGEVTVNRKVWHQLHNYHAAEKIENNNCQSCHMLYTRSMTEMH